MSPILIVLLDTNCEPPCEPQYSATNVHYMLSRWPNIIRHSLYIFGGILDYIVAITITYKVIFNPNFNHPW